MMPYIDMPPLPRNIICIWMIMLILGFLSNIIVSALNRRRHVVGSCLSILILYGLIQVCRDISCWYMGRPLHPAAGWVGRLPFVMFVAAGCVFTILLILFTQSVIRYSHTHITPSAVKEAMDQNPTGICYYRDNGQLILVNHRMHDIAYAVTGHVLLSGSEFYDEIGIRQIMELDDSSVIRFSHRSFDHGGERCHELIADDITELHRKSEALRRENELLQSQNRRMIEYGEHIDEMVRQQEILHTKSQIHDEMNRLLLSTDKAIREGSAEEKNRILGAWQKNILLLCMESDSGVKKNMLSDINALADFIGIQLTYDREPETEDADTLQLFAFAAAEALTNAAKHGGAKHLYIKIIEENGQLTAEFTNDGTLPEGMISEGGGLASVRSRIENAGGSVEISVTDCYTLTVSIPEGDDRNAISGPDR